MRRKARQCGRRDNEWERDGEEEDGNKGQYGDDHIVCTAQRTPGDTQQGLDDDHQDRGLDADERRLDDRDLAEIGIQDAQAEDDEGARQHEEKSGGKPAERAVQPPADIGRKLHGLWPRQQHAEVQAMQEAVLGDPPPLVDENAVHQRDLPRRSAEGQHPDLRPDGEGLSQGWSWLMFRSSPWRLTA